MIKQPQPSKLPFVSVVVPVRNSGGTIEACLRSLVDQDYPKEKLEVIIVDNNSRDGTRDIARGFPVFLLEQKISRNSYAARNMGIRHARGEIIAFTDSDCIASQDWLKNLIDGIEDCKYGCFAGEVLPYRLETLMDNYLHNIRHMCHKELLEYKPLPRAMTANLAFRSGIFQQLGLFDEDVVSGSDSEMVIRILTRTHLKVRFNHDAIVYHRHRTGPVSFYKTIIRYGWGEAMLLCKYPRYFHPYLGMGLQESLRQILPNMKQTMRYLSAPGGKATTLQRCAPFLEGMRHIAWHIGLQSGLFFKI